MKKIKRNIQFVTSLFLVMSFTNSCSQTIKLSNGTKVLSKEYKNINKFNNSTLKDIDTDYFYEKVDYYMADKNFKKVRDIGSDVNRKIQFYKNGRVRFFSLGIEDPNPVNAGRRGIIYSTKNSRKVDTQFASQGGSISKGTYSLKVENDKIFLLDDNFLFSNSEYICYEYVKSEKIPEVWKNYNADW